MGYEVSFDHIKGKNNVLVDIFSRRLTGIFQDKSIRSEALLNCEVYPQ